jgi:hypothetical protein
MIWLKRECFIADRGVKEAAHAEMYGNIGARRWGGGLGQSVTERQVK